VYACRSVYHQVLTKTQAIQRSPVSGGYDGAQRPEGCICPGLLAQTRSGLDQVQVIPTKCHRTFPVLLGMLMPENYRVAQKALTILVRCELTSELRWD